MTGLTIKGTHGTKSENRRKIENNGFNISKIGFLGAGVYFWKDGDYAIDLAMAWVRHRNPFLGQSQGIVFICKICLEDKDDLVDIDNGEIKERILKNIQKAGWSADKVQDISKAYDRFLEKYESYRGRPVLVVQGQTAHPPHRSNNRNNYDRDREYPVKVLQAPICYAALKSDIIAIERSVNF